jgi:hypothetical protein
VHHLPPARELRVDPTRALAQLAGFADEEIAAIADGAAAEGWTEADRVVLAVVDELLDEHHIGDDTWAALSPDPPRDFVTCRSVRANGRWALMGVA